MHIWRISNYADISGIGGLKFSARWHNKGSAIVYTAEHPALALLETLVHSNRANLPDSYKLLEILIPTHLKIQSIPTLKMGWQGDENYSRAFGDKWLKDQASAIAKVPSAIMPNSFNYLINPAHPQATEIKILKIENHPLDTRLK